MLTTEKNYLASAKAFPSQLLLTMSAVISRIVMRIVRAKVKVKGVSGVHLTETPLAAEQVEI
jgi:hypothetical protein